MRDSSGELSVNETPGGSGRGPTQSDRSELQLSVPRAVRGLVITSLVLAGVYLLTQESAIRFFPLPEWLTTIFRFFDVDEELSIPTWFSQMLLLLVAVFSVIAAKLQGDVNPMHSRAWGFLAIIFLFASIDEGVGFHEMLVGPLWVLLGIDDARFTLVWIFPALLVVVAVVLLLSRFLLTLDGPVRRLIIGGGVVFLTGAVAIEVLAVAMRLMGEELRLLWRRIGFIGTGLEELLEMLGAIIILWGVATQIARLSGSVRLNVARDVARSTTIDEVEH
ncbi:MAG: hypothetical protein KIT89_07435 [Microcella sp.]|uniref:hypothetical protein n=1 Tax=Microcella sp. TaxID=1913979 RepID=UPI0024CCCF1C|nr:hypothetical protein [Microcella sp.]UYN82590.1 MAG: hypothetical protein KIT89_07435 [Microcella sp.]